MIRYWWRRINNKTSVRSGTLARKRTFQSSWSNVQVLESRTLLSAAPAALAIPLRGGAGTVFRDSDGSVVRVILNGPGSGSITLTNGRANGGQIDTLTLTGTTDRSSLSIISTGGRVNGSSINQLSIKKAANATSALGYLDAPTLDLAQAGLLQADGNINSLRIRNIASNAKVSITGNVDSFTAQSIAANSEVHFGGRLNRFTANSIGTGANVFVVDQLGSFSVKGAMDSAQLLVGTAGITKFSAGSVRTSTIYSVGAIGDVTVSGDFVDTKLISNVFPGTDAIYGTKDDFAANEDVLHQGGIASLTVGGNLTGDVVESVGAVGTVTVGTRKTPAKMNNTIIVANVTPGADGRFGTLDDVALDPEFTRNITAVTVYGTALGNVVAANGRVVKAVTVTGTKRTGFVETPFSAVVSTPAVLSTLRTATASLNSSVSASANTISTTANTVVAGVGETIPLKINLGAAKAAFEAKQIFVTVYGKLNIPGSTETADDVWWYLTPTGFERVANLPAPSASTADKVELPTYSLDQFVADSSGNWTVSLPVSSAEGYAFSGRILISAGMPVQAYVEPSDHTVTAPSSANPTDPATGTLTDFLEFTVNPPHLQDGPELFIDTSQVDAFGLPLTLEVKGTSTDTTLGPVGVVQPRETVIALGLSDSSNSLNNYQYFINQMAKNNPRANAFAESFTTPASGVDGGVILATSSSSPIVITTNNVAGLKHGDIVTVSGVSGNTGANGTWQVDIITPAPGGDKDGIQAGTFTILKTGDSSNSVGTANTTAGGVWYLANSTPIRLVAPKDITAGLPDNPANSQAHVVDPLNTYFDQAIDQFFLKYYTGTINTPLVVTMMNGGSGYTTPPTVKFLAPGNGGTTATGTAIIKDGKVTGVIITNQGSGYTTAPTVVFEGGNGTGATASVTNTMQGGGQTLHLTHKGTTYNGNVVLVGSNYVLRFLGATGTPYDIYYPFFTTNLPTPNDQASDQNTGSDGTYTPLFPVASAPILANGKPAPYQYESPSQMIFACNGAFADGALRSDDFTKELVGDFENQISAAFNRGVALDAPADATTFWQTPRNWFPQSGGRNGVYNYWVQFFHQEKIVAKPGYNPINYPLAYAFAFDDQGGASSTIHATDVISATITLGSLSDKATKATTTTLSDISLSGSTLRVTAKVASTTQGDPVPTGTVTFFVNGIPLSTTTSVSASKPAPRPITLQNGTASFEGILPGLPDAALTHTYQITAVYSGDTSDLPSVGFGSVTNPGSKNPANTTGLSLYSVTAGNSHQVTATATVGSSTATSPSGKVTFNLLDDTNTTIATLAKDVPVNGYVATATFDPSQINFTPPHAAGPLSKGTYTIQSVYTDASTSSTSSATFTVKPVLTATQLAFDVQPPTMVSAGMPFSVTVSLENETGDVLPIYGGVVTLTPGNAKTPDFNSTARVVNGLATFNLKFSDVVTDLQLKATFTSPDHGNPPPVVSIKFKTVPLATLTDPLGDNNTSSPPGAAAARIKLTDGAIIPKDVFFVQIGETYQFVVDHSTTTWQFIAKIGPTGQTHPQDTPITLAAGVAGLNQALDTTTTTFEVNDGFSSGIQGFPTLKQLSDKPYFIKIDNEIMQLISYDETANPKTFNVSRGQQGTTAATHTTRSIINLLS